MEYIHSSKNESGTAFSNDENIKLRFALPRSLGTTYARLVLLSEYENEEVASFDLLWDFCDLGYDFYIADIKRSLGKGLYFFYLEIEGISKYYGLKCGRNLCFSKDTSGSKFQLSVCDFKYEKPEKNYGGIIYHVFVDRFSRGGEIKKRDDAVFIEDWDSEIAEFPEYPGAFLKNNTFFGGTIYGIIDKLDYIASLGVNVIYLSPIFEAYSNHKYDVGDYNKIDEMFGGDKALDMLISEAKKRNISLILDGVFNHTGADSIYFNKFSRYDSVGAYQSEKSPFYDWYDFQKHPDEYTCWWGIDILPRINPEIPECREFFTGKDGVIAKYSSLGIEGFRLDVADELSDDFISKIRTAQSENGTHTFLYGEVWEDASNKIAYDKRKHYYLGDELDGVMNYPLRTAIIEYLKNKKCDAMEYALLEVFPNMPKRIRDFSMNLLGTHDTERILTTLGGEAAEGKANAELRVLRMNGEEYATAKRRLLAAYTLLATLPGIPTIFYGDEGGMEGYSDPFNRRPVPWGRMDQEILNHYKMIGKLRRNNPIYREGDFKVLHLDANVLAFERFDSRNSFITVVNNSSVTRTLRFSDKAKNMISFVSSEEHAISSESALVFFAKSNNSFEIL